MTTILDNDITVDERPYVLELQTYLRAIQRDRTGTTTVPRDGYYGADTAAGVREFQAGAGLPQTGRADRETWEAIFTAYETVRRAAQPPLDARQLPRDTASSAYHPPAAPQSPAPSEWY